MFDNISNSKNEFYDFVSLPHNPEEIFELLYIIQKNERYEIYKAINNESREIYSIKIISLGDSTFHQKLKEEILIMKSLNKCENVVKYFGSYFCLKTKKIWLIYEYCPPGSIFDLMKVIEKPLTEHELSIIINDILKALSFIHQLNIVHNHIKLSNILLTENAVSKLSNFSYATKISNNSLLFSKDNEKSIKKNGDPKYDIFLLGIFCIEIFKGIKNNNFDSKKLLDLNNSKERYSPQKIIEKIFFYGNEQLCNKDFLDFVKRFIETNP
jgi:serine/threonine protein kinase